MSIIILCIFGLTNKPSNSQYVSLSILIDIPFLEFMRYILQKEIKKQGATMNYDKDGQSRKPVLIFNSLNETPLVFKSFVTIADCRFPIPDSL